MPQYTPQQALPVPAESDKPDVPVDLLNLANAIEKRLVGYFATTNARDTAIPGPTDGQFCYIGGTNTFYVYQDGAWTVFPAAQIAITSGTSVPSNSSGNNGDVFFKTS